MSENEMPNAHASDDTICAASEGASQPIRILLADDHPVVRDGLEALLGSLPAFVVIATAGDGRQAVDLALQHRPDLLLLDLEMPVLDGIAALREVRVALPSIRVIVFTAYDTDERIFTAIRAGAAGYLLKGAPREELFQAIRVVAAGGSLLAPAVAARMIASATSTADADSNTTLTTSTSTSTSTASSAPESDALPPLAEALTARELEVLAELAEGQTNREIAARLGVTERTVKFHVTAILAKLEAGNRTEAVRVALRRGLVEL